MSIDEDYCKPIRINSAINGNYIEYESKGDKDKTLSINKYLDIIRTYLSYIINNHKNQGESEIQLAVIILYFPKILMKLVICTQTDNMEIMIGNETDEIIKELYESLLERYQEGLE